MPHHLFIVATYAVSGREAELDRWYDEQHIPDLLKIPGIVAARRYKTTPVKLPEGVGAPDSVAMYDFDTDDPVAIIDEMGRRMGTPELASTPALDSRRTIAFIASRDHDRS